MITPLRPIYTAPLFPPLARRLIALLRSLTPAQWTAPTCYPDWKPRDIASHLLQTGIARLSGQRDAWLPELRSGPVSAAFADVAGMVAGNNERWERAAAGWSPRLITELLAVTEPALARFSRALDPAGPAFYAVAWAGEMESHNWFDIGREYTERWHHQEQIREAVGAPPLTRRRFLGPVIALLMRAVPYWYRETASPDGTLVDILITGPAGGRFVLRREKKNWRLYSGAPSVPTAARVTLTDDSAWRLLTRSIPRGRAPELVRLEGDRALGERFFDVKAIMMED